MNNEILVSVIVAIYNGEKYINKCVDSIINQSYPNLEIILVDDCSPDNCGVICDQYAAIDNRIKVIHHKKNMGLASGRNSGIENSNGEYIIFVDGDDYIDSHLVENAVNKLVEDGKPDAVQWGYRSIDEKDGSTIETVLPAYKSLISGDVIADDFMNIFTVSYSDLYEWFSSNKSYDEVIHSKKQMATVWRYLFSLSVIKNNNMRFNTKAGRGEDIVFLLSFLQIIKSITFLDESPYYYLQREGSMIREDKNVAKKVDLMIALNSVASYKTNDETKIEEIKNKWQGQRVLIVMNTARKLAGSTSYLKGCREFKLFANHEINRDAYEKLDLSKAPFKYKVAMGLIKHKLYMVFYTVIFVLTKMKINVSPMD